MITLPAYGETEERTLRSHLRLMHGVYTGDIKTGAGLAECHQHEHEHPAAAAGRPIKHKHADDTEIEEFEW